MRRRIDGDDMGIRGQYRLRQLRDAPGPEPEQGHLSGLSRDIQIVPARILPVTAWAPLSS